MLYNVTIVSLTLSRTLQVYGLKQHVLKRKTSFTIVAPLWVRGLKYVGDDQHRP